jgi:phosphoglycerate dehydrogenase-like enzyme
MTPRILVLLPPSLYARLFTPETNLALRGLGDVIFNEREENLTSTEFAAIVGDYDAVVTSWGSPRFTDEVLAAADNLKLIGHAAGSIKSLLPPPVFERGIAVTHAAAAMGRSVAEFSLLFILMGLRRVDDYDRRLKAGEAWAQVKEGFGHDIRGTKVGVVGAGYVGRQMIALLQAVGAEVIVTDPYLSEAEAQALGVQKADLRALLQSCPVVTLHAPPTEATRHMIGAAELGLLQNGAVFVNTARAWLVDEAALVRELGTGRIWAALDVFEQEPLPDDHPLRTLDNVILTPHIASKTYEADERISQIMVEEIRRFFNGDPLQYRVTGAMLATMA